MNFGFLTPPGPLVGSDETMFWLFSAATIVMVVVAVAMAASETRRLASLLPLTVFVSATLWLPNEPFIDAILGFQYAADSPVVLFTLWDRVLPLQVIGVGAMFFIFPWTIYRLVLSGTTLKRIVVICVAAGVIDWLLEWPAIYFGLFEYYGDNPSRVLGLPLTSMVQNIFIYALMAAAILFAAPHLKGWRYILFLPVIPGCYLGGAVFCTWPAYLALHAAWPPEVFIPLAVIAAAINVYVPLVALRIAAEYNEFRRAHALKDPVPAMARPPVSVG